MLGSMSKRYPDERHEPIPPEERTEQERKNAAKNQFLGYVEGWKAGAAVHAMNPSFSKSQNVELRDAYNQGYSDGRDAYRIASDDAAESYGHEIRHVYLADGEGSPA